jgi:cyclophilin family peptidyl-prolyl cis-trans isomerase
MSQKKSLFGCALGFLLLVNTAFIAASNPNPLPIGNEDNWAHLVDSLTPVWKAGSQRDEHQLFEFVQDTNVEIRNAAWRALGNFTVEDTQRLLSLVLQANTQTAWFALSTQTLSMSQIEAIITYASNESPDLTNLAGIYLVLGKQGNGAAHAWLHDIAQRCLLQDNPDLNPMNNDSTSVICAREVRFDLALAVSRSLNRHQQAPTNHMLLLQHARSSFDVMEQAAWMYGWYRTPSITLPDEVLTEMIEWMNRDWPEAYGLVRQYWISLLGRHQHELLPELLIAMPVEELHVLEWVEGARALANWSNDSYVVDQGLIKLLNSPFYQVRAVALQSILTRYEYISEPLRDEAMKLNPEMQPLEKLFRHQIIVRSDPGSILASLSSEDGFATVMGAPTLLGSWMALLRDAEGIPVVLDYMREVLLNRNQDDFIRTQLAREAIRFVATSSGVNEPEGSGGEVIRNLIYAFIRDLAADPVLSSAGVVASAVASLANTLEWFNTDVDISTELREMLRFGALFEDFRAETLLEADPSILKRVGPTPVWIIHTTSGTLKLRLDPLLSPSTVTAYYTLTQDGLHVGTPFHRIVPNFVIQSGELWQGNTAGSPEFRIPTEASEKTFARGTLGVASAGRDTEGSQFFVMHMWHPHLDGGYTNFGYLLEGYEVLDALLQGASVLSTEWR